MFHYVACGLPNIFLVNGYTESELPNGQKTFKIDDVKGLHKAIGMHLVQKESILDGDEFRFLRTEMLLSRKGLGELLGYSLEALKKWESGENKVQKSADVLLRILYKEFVMESSAVRDLVEKLNEIERKVSEKISFAETDQGWVEKDCA
ncbi:helix-turn-helix domain-containing protein [Alloalcanivorax xenomutans]|uniref:helix-turn-helix domain-containing protein n=1 Tax=Alloalcanivorax xenomutans TaxID=1094342 RepID=UPI0006D83ACF|nr:transcriptional regulator [Alloalcanivorax xenomutans]